MYRYSLSLSLMTACLSGACAAEDAPGAAQTPGDVTPRQQSLSVPTGPVPDSSHLGNWNHPKTSPTHGEEAASKDAPVGLIATLSQSGGMIAQTTLTSVYADGKVVVTITTPSRGEPNKSERSERTALASKDQIESLRQALVDEAWHKAEAPTLNVIIADATIQTIDAGGHRITVIDESTEPVPTRTVLSLMRQLSASAIAGPQR